MPWKPRFEGEFPTLGWGALEWMSTYLGHPSRQDGGPLVLTREQARFVLEYYRLDPTTCRRVYRGAVWSRPKGHGKSPLMGGLAITEALADVVPDGWDADGRPVGKPWATILEPICQLAAVSEDQTRNAYRPLQRMILNGAVIDEYAVEPMNSFISMPWGRVEFVTSAADSREGDPIIFAAMDQTESWTTTNGGIELAATLRRNVGKNNGSTIETPNAYNPDRLSVSQMTAEAYQTMQEGRARSEGLLYDHREAPPSTDLTDRESLRAGLLHAYGDSAADAGGWVDIDRIISEVWDPRTTDQQARQYYLNQVTKSANAWLSRPDLADRARPDVVVKKDEPIVLGFDGSRGRTKGKADATALVGCTVRDGHLFKVGIWEARDGDQDWTAPVAEVEAEVAAMFANYNVVGMYVDPSGWQTQVASWEARYNRDLKIKASRDAPMTIWPRGKGANVTQAVEQLRLAIVQDEMTIDGDPHLMRHLLNAQARETRSGYLLYKETPSSALKIDAAYAAVMAWKARTDALGKGLDKGKRNGAVFF